jgi:aminopeptidase N
LNNLEEQFHCKGAVQALADGRFVLSGATPHYAPDRSFDTRHIRLELELDFKRRSLSGRATTSLTALADDVREMVFDAVQFQNLKVSSNRGAVTHEYNGRQIRIQWAKPLTRGTAVDVTIGYRVTRPKLGLHFVGPDAYDKRKPQQAWTQGEDEYNRYWFPCHDAPQERATTEMIVAVPAPFTAVSNGALVRKSRRGRSNVFHWKHDVPHSPYLVSLAVGEFSEIKDKWKGVPVLYFCPPGREEDAKRAFGKTPKMIDFFSKRTGVAYPYAKYSQVAALDFIYGGMENTSSTTQTALTLHDERAHQDFSSDPLVAHELAHQWFGDLVTCKDWSHAWLNESFATYFEALFKEYDLGYDEFMYELRGNAEAYFSEDRERYRRPIVTKLYKNTNDLFDRHLYEKGSLVLHMIRSLLGETAWWRSINLYLKRHRTQGVETVNLIDAIQESTGKNMRPFFDQWVYKAGHPEYKVRSWWDARAKKQFVRVLQTQPVNDETGLFSMPVTLAFRVRGKEQRFTETVDKKDQLLTFALAAEPELVLFDPDHVILKKIDFVKSEAMWIQQLREDPHVLGRVDAAAVLARFGTPQAVRALAEALTTEKFWGVQVEIAGALGRIESMASLEALLSALHPVTHPKVRRALFEALSRYSDARAQTEIQALHDSEKSYFAQAEAIRALGRMRNPALFGLLREWLAHDSWNDVIRCAAIDAIAALKIPESMTLLMRYSKPGFSPSARMTAIRGLAGYAAGRDEVQQHLLRLLADPYLLVQMTVVRTLAQVGDERAVPALMKYTTGDLDGRLKRTAEEAVRRIRKGMDPEFPTAQKKAANVRGG